MIRLSSSSYAVMMLLDNAQQCKSNRNHTLLTFQLAVSPMKYHMIGKDYTLVEDLHPCAVLYKIGKKCAPVEAPWQLPIMDAALHFGLAWTQH